MCGKPLVVPEQPAAAPIPQATLEPEGTEAPGTPWENRAALGFWPAWLQTMQLALLEPSKLFREARLDRGPDQIRFAVLTTSIFWAIGQIAERAMFAGQSDMMRKLLSAAGNPDVPPMWQKLIESQAKANSWGMTIFLTVFTPLLAFVLVYLNAGVTHAVALMLGQAKRGFPATFAACAYSCAPLVLLAIPACGSIIAVIWLVVLTGIGMKETHRISSGGAAATVIAPYFIFCCLIGAGTLALAMTVGRTMGQP